MVDPTLSLIPADGAYTRSNKRPMVLPMFVWSINFRDIIHEHRSVSHTAMPSTSLRVEASLYMIMVIISISSILLLYQHLLAREFKRGYDRVSNQSVIQSVLQFCARHSPPIYL